MRYSQQTHRDKLTLRKPNPYSVSYDHVGICDRFIE